MKWFLAGLLFAALVGLGVVTAAVQVTNVHRRARIALLVEQLDGSRIGCSAAEDRFREAARVERLIALWQRFEAIMARRGGS